MTRVSSVIFFASKVKVRTNEEGKIYIKCSLSLKRWLSGFSDSLPTLVKGNEARWGEKKSDIREIFLPLRNTHAASLFRGSTRVEFSISFWGRVDPATDKKKRKSRFWRPRPFSKKLSPLRPTKAYLDLSISIPYLDRGRAVVVVAWKNGVFCFFFFKQLLLRQKKLILDSGPFASS